MEVFGPILKITDNFQVILAVLKSHKIVCLICIEIKVEMNVDDANEYLALDSVLVRGYGEYDSLNSQYTLKSRHVWN